MAITSKRIKKKSALPTTTLAESGMGAEVPRRIKRLNVLIYGPPGTAKTVNAHGMPNTRTLDLDDGMQSVEWAIRKGILNKRMDEIVYKTILPPSGDYKSSFVLDEASDTIDEWLDEEDTPDEEWDKPYAKYWDTLIIDSGSSLTDATILKALKENDRHNLSKSYEKLSKGGITPMRMQDWGSASSLFQKFINNCRTIGKNVVLICHEYESTDDEGNVLSYDPLLIGQLRQKIAKDFDEVYYAHVGGTRQVPKYLFQTTPDLKHHLRSRLGCLDPIEEADFGKIKKKIAKFYGVDADKLWVGAHGSEEREKVISEEVEEGSAV